MIERVGQFEITLNDSRGEDNLPGYFGYYYPADKYIHNDGELRDFTLHNGTFSGYFSTIEEVKEAIKLFQSKYAK